jgi:type III pantothenate kinase
MYLAIDIGNTRTKVGVYDVRKLVKYEYYRSFTLLRLKRLCAKFDIKGIALCASGIIDSDVSTFLKATKDVIFLTHDSKLPITIKYQTPLTLGKDRIAAAIGAKMHTKTGQGVVVINMGTCITMDFIDKNGFYLGGNISPGMNMRIKAMHKFTAKLPMVEKNLNKELLGYNTETAIQNGAVAGANREIDSFIDQVKEKYQPINIIVAGGDAEYFVKYTKKAIFARPYIVLEGLIEILIYNGI